MDRTVDIVVIGAGPGGLSAAGTLALHGRDVLVISDGHLMGYGIEGAFKSKAGFEIARLHAHATMRRDLFELSAAPSFDAVEQSIEHAAKGLGDSIQNRLDRLGIEVVESRGRFIDANSVMVGDDTIRARHIVVATGTAPRVFPGVRVDGYRILTSDEIVGIKFLPKSLLILGAGIIGCEFASIFNGLGSKVKLVDTQDRILGSEDEDVSRFLSRGLSMSGVDVIHSCRFEDMEVGQDSVTTSLSNGQQVVTESVLFAVGRNPNTDGLDTRAAGIDLDDRGYISVGDDMRTNVPHIYAVGDVGQRNTPMDIALVHVAQAEGRCAAYSILGEPFALNMDHVPYIIFTMPMIAGAGLSETVARERHGNVRVGKYPYGRNHRAHATFPPIGFVKLIVGPDGDDRILGIRAIGSDADVIVGAASIMIDQALPYTYILNSIMPHPSLLECLEGAAHIIAGDALSYEEGEEYSFNYLIDDKSA
ncbi:MAG: NAD(P)/FAD-dependent oxidoreductase [Alphaproteobacteria bacterium]